MNMGERLVEINHNYRIYFVPESMLAGVNALKMPDGTFIDLSRTEIEYDYNCTPTRYELIGKTSEYKIWGKLPTLNVVELQGVEKHRPN